METRMNKVTKLALLAIAALGATAAQAQTITYLTVRGSSIYQVIPGGNTGGRYVDSPRTLSGIRCAGYTDRVMRGELYAALITPTNYGFASEIGFTVKGALRARTFNQYLPWLWSGWVSLNVNDDDVVWYAKTPLNARGNSLRLPIGTR